ncbi:MAG: bifunctional 4-hydroxy-3-methylbut-2-enyl diphosphate reductase/30S ribosomal protein S1 [Oscillospiraceae bacterium]|jgi:4-hydroxy-3-methylbut-2-enyl diphosphate reductase|nr:bifunctional 4-hydroxy-3-methylbut-2-enyl diphosphate reductase/30S ribosomal protein S1 [Oscillospiraceae bacterium]
MPDRLVLRVARTLGFCFGVSRAVRMAEEAASAGGLVSTWGPLIHNRQVTDRLANMGVTIVAALPDCAPGQTVVLRSHGVPHSVVQGLSGAGCPVVDATCPYVARIHRLAEALEGEGRLLFILGEEAHPEVRGIAGYCRAPVIVRDAQALSAHLANGPDIRRIPCALLTQTTTPRALWESCAEILKKLCTNVKIVDTICNATLLRQEEAARLARTCDAMVVVGDRASANASKLAEICRTGCARVLQVERASDWPTGWLRDTKNVGLTAGTSTPPWAIEEVYQAMSEEIKGELLETPAKDEESGAAVSLPEPLPEPAPTQDAPIPQPSSEPAPVSDEAEPPDADAEESFEALLEKSLRPILSGDKVTGMVTAITPTEVHVDLGAKYAGYIPLTELSDDPDAKVEDMVKVGEPIDTFVVRVNDLDGVIALSKKRLDAVKGWDDVELAREDHKVMTGTVTEENKGGIVVTVRGVRVFVPASMTGLPKDTPMSTLLKQRVKVVVTEVNRARRRVVGSIRLAQNEERRSLADAVWGGIEVGKHYEGVVKSLTSFGCFVDIGGVDGMVHISELSWSRVKHPSEVVSVGDKLDVYVIGFDLEKKKISLGHKNPNENPWQRFIGVYREGDTANVRVVKLMNFGAFSEIIPGVDGLIHIGQIAEHRVNKPGDILAEGQRVDVKITAIDYDNKKVSLSIRALLEPEEPSEEDAALPDQVVASVGEPNIPSPAEESETTEADPEA